MVNPHGDMRCNENSGVSYNTGAFYNAHWLNFEDVFNNTVR